MHVFETTVVFDIESHQKVIVRSESIEGCGDKFYTKMLHVAGLRRDPTSTGDARREGCSGTGGGNDIVMARFDDHIDRTSAINKSFDFSVLILVHSRLSNCIIVVVGIYILDHMLLVLGAGIRLLIGNVSTDKLAANNDLEYLIFSK